MKKSHTIRLAALLLGVAAAVSISRAEVTNIEIIDTAGNLEIANSFFLRADDPAAHFSLATLGVQELAFPSTNPGGYWWDLVIKVTRSTSQVGQDVMMAIDKDVRNQTPDLWTDFHMTLGQGAGAGFVESDEFDFLFFKDQPPPIEETGAFHNPPMMDDPSAADNLWWFWDPANGNPGQPPGTVSDFWLGINVPDSLFDSPTGDRTMAIFTLRQHATIPEPSSIALLALGGVGAVLTLARRRGR